MKRHNGFSVCFMVTVIGLFILPMASLASAKKESTNSEYVRPIEGWFLRKYDPKIHTRETLPKKLLANKTNPNLQKPVIQTRTFQATIEDGLTPGLEYETSGGPICAAAAGIVHFIGVGRPVAGNEGGWYVRIYHDFYDGLKKKSYPMITLYRNQTYRSTYYHLANVVVKQYQSIRRGQVIGYAFQSGHEKKAKLVVEERGVFVNPDDYGQHGFMDYWDGTPDHEIDLDEMNRRLDQRIKIVDNLNSFYTNRRNDNVFTKIHLSIDTEKVKNYPATWSTLDRFRYLSQLYESRPALFPDLQSGAFRTMKKEFDANRPITLTLPFKSN